MSRQATNLDLSQLERILELLLAFSIRLEKEYYLLRKPLYPKSLYEQSISEQTRNRLIKDMRDISILQTHLKSIIQRKLCA